MLLSRINLPPGLWKTSPVFSKSCWMGQLQFTQIQESWEKADISDFLPFPSLTRCTTAFPTGLLQSITLGEHKKKKKNSFRIIESQDCWGWQGPQNPSGPTPAQADTPRVGCPRLPWHIMSLALILPFSFLEPIRRPLSTALLHIHLNLLCGEKFFRLWHFSANRSRDF